MAKIKGTTRTGFEFEIDDRIKNDWRLVTNIALAESEDMMQRVKGTSALVALLLGENEKQLTEHILKNNDGYVPMDAVFNELIDMIKGSDDLKN